MTSTMYVTILITLIIFIFKNNNVIQAVDVGVDGSKPPNAITWHSNLPSTPLNVGVNDVVYFKWQGSETHSIVRVNGEKAFANCDLSVHRMVEPATTSASYANFGGTDGLVLYFASNVGTDCQNGVKRKVIWGTISTTNTPTSAGTKTLPPSSSTGVVCKKYKTRVKCLKHNADCIWINRKCKSNLS
jgi:hypothetical protein